MMRLCAGSLAVESQTSSELELALDPALETTLAKKGEERLKIVQRTIANFVLQWQKTTRARLSH